MPTSRLLRSIILLVVSFFPVRSFAQTGVFVQPPQIATAAPPTAVVAADFNGDGKVDLAAAVTVNGVGFVSVLLGNGDGTFQPYVNYGTAGGPAITLAVGDFNGDGKPDIVVTTNVCITNQGCPYGEFSLLFGNGDGTFQPHVDYSPVSASSPVAVGDFNGDGKPDLALTNSSSISIFLNSGDGTFSSGKDSPAPSGLITLGVGDFNQDGKLDLAVAGNGVAILLGNGDGTFAAVSASYPVGNTVPSIAVADLNGDNIPDLVAVNYNNSGVGFPIPGNTTVLWGKGDGTFTTQTYPTELNTSSVAIGDFNGDGQLDFAVTALGVEIFLNQGHNSFSQPNVFYGETSSLSPGLASGGNAYGTVAVAADFNHDNKLDVAVLCGGICILFGDGDGGFSPTYRIYPTGSNPDAVAISDLNGDGNGDVIVANLGDNNIDVFLGSGGGLLATPVPYTTGARPLSLAVGDLNGDGKPDVVVGNNDGTTSVLLNGGSGSLLPKVDYSGGGFAAVGDLNGDGVPDIAVASDSNVTLLLGKGDGTFPNQLNFGVAGGSNLLLGDFNGDGRLDIAVLGGNLITLFLNQGGNNFLTSSITLPSQYSFAYMAAADLNADGKLDLVVSATSQFSDNGSVILLGNGDGTFQNPITGPTFGNQILGGTSIAVSDFNSDGIPDLAMSGFGLGLALGNGDGTFQSAAAYPSAPNHAFIAAGDLNGDGKPDLAEVVGTNGNIPGVGSNVLIVLLNTAQPGQSFRLTLTPASQAVNAGNSASFTVTATTTNGFASAVALTCPAAPPTTQCTISPTSVTPTASGATATVTVKTTATSSLGTYALQVNGTGGSQSFKVKSGLTINVASDFTLGVPSVPNPSSVAPGSSAQAAITLTPSATFSGTVNFTCAVTPSSNLAPTCSLNPSQVQVSAGSTASSTLTISTTGPSAKLLNGRSGRNAALLAALAFPFLGLSFGWIRSNPKRGFPGKVIMVAGIWLLLAISLSQVACGGSSHSTSGGTPSGNYTVSITAMSGSTQHTVSTVLAVQ